MSDIVLVQPHIAMLDELLDRSTLPISLLAAASVVAQDHQVVLFYQRTTRDWEGELRAAVRSGPTCVGITAMTGVQITGALAASAVVKEEDPEIPVVWGGPHPTLDPEGTVSHPLVDVAVVGDGEYTLEDLVNALETGRPLSSVKGIVYAEGDAVHVNPRRPHTDLDDIPDPPFHLVDIEKYIIRRRNRRCISLCTSRGCPYQCTYCFSPVECNGRWRGMSAPRALDLVTSAVERFNLGFVWFAEQNAFVDRRRMLDICQGFVDRGLDILWEAEAHVTGMSRFTDDELALVARAGMADVVIGVETGSQRIADSIRKGLRIDTVVPFNRRIARYSFHPRYCFMTAFPGETEEELADTVRLMHTLLDENPRASTTALNPVIPYPNSTYLAEAKRHGLVPPDSLEGWARYDAYAVLQDGLDHSFPWVTPERAALLRRLYMLSSFTDDKLDFIGDPVIRILYRLYRPIARKRFFNLNTDLMGAEEMAYRLGYDAKCS